MLDAFCKENFQKTSIFVDLGGVTAVQYLELKVESVVWDDNHTDKIEGKVIFRYLYGFLKRTLCGSQPMSRKATNLMSMLSGSVVAEPLPPRTVIR